MTYSTTSIDNTSSVLQQSSQPNPTTPVLINGNVSLRTSSSAQIPIQQSAVLSSASLPNTPTVSQFCLPRPVDLAETRLKQSTANKARANKKKQTQASRQN